MELTLNWQLQTASGIVCFDSLDAATDWIIDFMARAPRVSIARVA